METPTSATPDSNTDLHIPGVYLGSPDAPKTVVELSPIRTMKNDIAEAVKNQKESLVSIAVAEDKKKSVERAVEAAAPIPESQPVPTAPRPIGRIIIVIVLILIIVGAGLAYKFVLPKLPKINIPEISIPSFGSPSEKPLAITTTDSRVDFAPSLIKATTEKRFDTNKETPERIFTAVASLRVAEGSKGDIKNIYFYEEVSGTDASRSTDLRDTIPQDRKTVSISANKLIILSGVSTSEILSRSLENTFMAGLFNEEAGSTPTPFIILKVSGYDTGFAGMLEWERNLPRFFDTVFGTNTEAGLTGKTKMRDVVLSGRDARVLEITPTISIAYAFANPSTIVIASSRNALEKLLSLVPTK